jgi:hypothetical protein
MTRPRRPAAAPGDLVAVGTDQPSENPDLYEYTPRGWLYADDNHQSTGVFCNEATLISQGWQRCFAAAGTTP